MQVKSWLGASPITDQCLSVDAADLALRPSLSNHPWFLRFPSEKQKSASRKNLFRLEAPWPRREIQSWDLAAVTRTLTYENYAVFIPNGVRRVKRFLWTSPSRRGGRPTARGYGFCPSSCRLMTWRKVVKGCAPLSEVASIVPSAAVLPMKKVGVPGT